MSFVIVPDSLSNAINEKLDNAFLGVQDAAKDRDYLYRELLSFYDEHGYLPDFSLVKGGQNDSCV